jgi:hypothetical protein
MGPDSGCYFYHIPKTAGMSTWQLLEVSFPADEICTARMWDDLVQIPPRQIARYRAFRGHFLAFLEPYIDRPLKTFTVLRDPVERTISHYYHVKRSPDHPSHGLAQILSLTEFCVHPRTRHMVVNYQCGYLASFGDRAPHTLVHNLTPQDLADYKLQLALDPRPEEYPAPEQLLRAAVERLDGFVAVGITELLQPSFGLIADALGVPPPPRLPIRNAANNRPPRFDEETLRVIRAQTEVDRALYEMVRRRVESKLRPFEFLRDATARERGFLNPEFLRDATARERGF